MLKLVLFDAAGTLFDTAVPVGTIYANLARRFGVEADSVAVAAAFRRVFREAPPLAFGTDLPAFRLRQLEKEWWRRRVAETFAGLGEFNDFDAYFEELFARFADPSTWQADSEAVTTLQRLKQSGLMLGLVSNFDYRVYGLLEGLGLRRFFQSVTISSEVGYAKPAPELFQVALSRHQVTPGEAVHVGDSAALDVAGANAAKIPAFLLDHSGNQSLRSGHMLTVIRSLAEIPALLAKSS